jgi:thiol-disulfide isomerase/thioredoxin
MLRLALVLVLAGGCVKSEPPPGASGSAPAPVVVPAVALNELKPAQGELKALLVGEAGKAAAQHLKPFAYVSATWCGPCNTLKHSLDNPKMIDAFKGTYIIKLDSDAWDAQLAGAGIAAPAIPVFFQLDTGGKPTGKKIDGGAWDADTVDNMAPVLSRFFHS